MLELQRGFKNEILGEIDLFTKDRVPTGLTKKRSEIAPEDFKHQVVHVCIFNSKNQMLIQQRTPDKKGWPNLWDFSIGGHVDAGETPIQGAMRELKEELGIDIDLSNERPFFTINFERGFDDFFLIQAEPDLINLKLQVSEVQSVQWATLDQIKKMLQDKTFIPYKASLIDFVFEQKDCRGAHQ